MNGTRGMYERARGGGQGGEVRNGNWLIRGSSDEYCPHCDNHFVIDAKTPQAALRVEGEDIRKDSRFVVCSFSRGGSRC